MNPIRIQKHHICPFLLTLAIASVSLLSGCGPSGPSLKSVASNIVEMRDQIRDGFAANDIDKAHGPLHEVGHAIEKLGSVAETSGLSGDELKAVKEAGEELFEAFGQVDLMLHGKEGKTYDEVSESIDKALKTITDIAGVENNTPAKVSMDNSGQGSETRGDGLPASDGDPVVEEAASSEDGSGTTEEAAEEKNN